MKVGLWGLALCAVLLTGCNALRWSHEASEVTYQQVRPQELLRKYERFKEVRAALDAKRASIEQFRSVLAATRADYAGTPMKDWPLDARETFQQRRAELHGMIASFNLLAADFNSAMSKENYRFCDVGRMPEGLEGMEPLPRKYVPYMLN